MDKRVGFILAGIFVLIAGLIIWLEYDKHVLQPARERRELVERILREAEDTTGRYHNAETGEQQRQYMGSREQQSDLDAIDAYAREHPEF